MIELHADDWYTVTGRGTIATVGVEQVTKPVNVGDRVIIDSKQYEVRGIEVTRGLTDPPVILAYGFVVQPWYMGPQCCTDDCCGPGSYCCSRANPHTHDDQHSDGDR